MVFTSAVFLYLFLPLFLLVYYLLPGRARLAWMAWYCCWAGRCPNTTCS